MPIIKTAMFSILQKFAKKKVEPKVEQNIVKIRQNLNLNSSLKKRHSKKPPA